MKTLEKKRSFKYLLSLSSFMIDDKAKNILGFDLPNAPSPVGSYVPVTVVDRLVFVSGQIPLDSITDPDSPKLKFKGRVGKELNLEQSKEAAKLCAINSLSQLKSYLGSLDKIRKIVKVTGFVNCEPSFEDHPKVIDGASDLLVQIFGQSGKHCRVSVGCSSLPLGSAVEIEIVAEIAT